jgi:predicted nucleic acid-binding protein
LVSVVVDASAIVDFLLDGVDESVGRVIDDDPLAPDLVYAEATNALARTFRQGIIDRSRLALLVDTLVAMPLDIISTCELVQDSLEYVDRVSAYDACYVALAVREGALLLTADRKLARTHDLPVEVRVV